MEVYKSKSIIISIIIEIIIFIFSELDDVAKLLNKSDSDSSRYLIFLINKCLTITVCLLCVYNMGQCWGKYGLERCNNVLPSLY